MEQVFRIEIPIEAHDNTDMGSMQRLEALLAKIYTSIERNTKSTSQFLNALTHGSSQAQSSLQGVEQAEQSAANASENLGDSVEDVGDAFTDTGHAAQQAGQQSGSAFNSASSNVDRFGQRVERTNKTLRQMAKEKINLIMAAIDKASPILNTIKNTAKNITAKAWNIALHLKDFVTAPFRKIYSMLSSPITIALSLAGVGLSANSIVSTFNNFATGMSNVKALSGATEEEFIRLSDTAEKLGATTKYTAAEASEGMKYLAMAGWNTNQIIDAMPGLLNLAAAGATDLSTAADIVSDVMTAMGMEASEASRAADVFAKTATATNTSIEGLGATMKYAAPIANSFGLSLEDVSAAAGLMANAGIKGEMAGTALRGSLLRMAKPTSDMQKAMSSLGISFTDSTGKMKSMGQIVKMLETSFQGMSEADKLANAQILFGTEAASAWLGVISQGSAAYDELAESLYGAKGAAEAMANTQLDNLAGDMTLLQSAVDGMQISLMKKLNPYARQAVQWLTGKIPQVTEMLTGAIDKGIAKVKQLKDRFTDMLDSREFKNADGFVEKAFVAWDKMIAEPFNEWWNGSGQKFVKDAAGKIGKGFGEAAHGIVMGIFAAIKGEDIDFEGLNITGIAQAGATAAKEFVSSFLGGLNAGELAGAMPGFLKAGLLGFGALKIGGGIASAAKTISALKLAFTGTATAAGAAGTATAGYAAATATAAAGTAQTVSVLGGLKAVLTAIPGWGWLAAAAIAAVAIGIKAYNDAQEKHRQEMLNAGFDAQKAADNYKQSASAARQVAEAFDGIHEIEIKIAAGSNNTKEVQTIQAQIDEIKDRKVWLEAQIASGSLTPEQIAAYQAELDQLTGVEATLTAQLAADRVREKEVKEYAEELSALESRNAILTAELQKDNLTAEQIESYMAELGINEARMLVIQAQLEDYGVTETQLQYVQDKCAEIDGLTSTATIILEQGGLTPEQAEQAAGELAALYTRKAEIELVLTGAASTPEEVATLRSELEGIQNRKAEIEYAVSKGEATDDMIAEYNSITDREATINLLLSGLDLTQEQLGSLMTEYGNITSTISAKYDETSGLSQSQLSALASTFDKIGDISAKLNVSLEVGSLTPDDLEAYNLQLETLYKQIEEMTGGAFTEEGLRSGAQTEEQARQYVQARSDRDLSELRMSVANAKVARDEVAGYRESAAAEAAAYSGDVNNATTARGLLATMQEELMTARNNEDAAWTLYDAGMLSYEEAEAKTQATTDKIAELQERYGTDIAPLLMASDGTAMAGLNAPAFMSMYEGKGFEDILTRIDSAITDRGGRRDAAQAKYDNYDASLLAGYGAERDLAVGEIFNGTELAGYSIEEAAALYTQMSDEGKAAFEQAIEAVNQLNQSADYITDDQKTNAVTVVEMAEKAEVMGAVQANVQSAADAYSAMDTSQREAFKSSAEGVAQLEGINKALENLGLDKIESLDQIGEALEAIKTADVSQFSLDTVQAAFAAVTGKADGMKTSLANLKAQLEALDGTTATVTVIQNGGAGDLPKNAEGGIYNGAFLSWVAEDGPEAIIPLGANRRGRGLDLWLEAGRALGIQEYADGGIVAPFADALESMPDSIGDDAPAGGPIPNGGSTISLHVSVEANPNYTIEGGDANPETIMDVIRSKQSQIAELLGAEFAEQLNVIMENMA